MTKLNQAKEYITENILTIGLIITFLAAVALRFKGLTVQSYWADEIVGMSFSKPSNSFSLMYEKALSEPHPPFYQMLLWAWFKIFGYTEYAGRSLSAAIGSLAVFAVYFLGKQVYNKEVGIYAAMIASLNYFALFYSQEVRSYALLFLLSTLSFNFFVQVITKRTKKGLFLYLLATPVLLYTHYFGFFLVMTQAIVFVFYIIQEKENRKRLFGLGVAAGVGILASISPLLDSIINNSNKSQFWVGRPSADFFIQFMKNYVNSHYLEVIFLVLLVMSLRAFSRKSENKEHKTMTIVLLLWVFFGYLLPYIRSVTSTPILVDRYTMIVLPAFMLLSAYGIFMLKKPKFKIIAVVIVVFFSSHQIIATEYYTKAIKQDYRGILSDILMGTEKVPVYEVVPFYSLYQEMLQFDIYIEPDTVFPKIFTTKLNNDSLEKCFFLVDGHSDFIGPHMKAIESKPLTAVHVFNRSGTSAILFANNTDPHECAKLYPHLTVNPDRHYKRFGSWY